MSEEESTYKKEQKEYESILSELPELVKNRFDNRTVEGEYPVSYGKYHYDNEYQNRRIKFYKDYSQNPLTELKEKQRIITAQIDKKEQEIYRLAAESIRLANKYLSKSKANVFKDEIILWLLAACREGEGYPGTGNGFCGLWDIDLSSLDIETESNLLQSKINQLNRHRAEWFELKERQQIIRDCYNNIALDDPDFKENWNESPARASKDEEDQRRGPRGLKEMWDYIEDELNWSQEEARKWIKEHGSMNAAANEMIKQLKKKFPEAEKYPSPTRVQEKLGYKKDSGTYVLGPDK